MRPVAGVRRAGAAAGRQALGAARWLGLAEGGPAAAPRRQLSWGFVPGPVRRAGRWALVRGLASAAFRPGRWGAGLALAGFLAPGPWWLASIAVVPLSLYRWVSKPSEGRASTILMGASRRVKSLRLRRTLLRSWTPLMVRLGLSRQVERRRWRGPATAETLVPRLGRVRLTEYGVTTSVSLQRLALPVSAMSRFAEHIESGLPVPECNIRKTGEGLATMDLRHTDPLATPVRTADLPEPVRYLHVVPQLAADGRGVEQPLPPLHLTVGATRAGKSTRAWALIQLILDLGVPLRLRIFDPKRQEWPAMAEAAYDYECDVARWPEFLGRAYGALRKRQASLAARGVGELRRFTDSDPLDLMILDEFLSVLPLRNADVRVGDRAMKAHAVLDLYASQCLAAGYGLEAAAQLGQKEVIGSVRDLFPAATILRVPPQASEMVDAVLGPGAKHLYPAHEIAAGRHTAGVGYTRTPAGPVLRTRVLWLDGDERAELVRRVAEETVRLGGSYRQKRTKRSEREPAGVS